MPTSNVTAPQVTNQPKRALDELRFVALAANVDLARTGFNSVDAKQVRC